MASVVTGSLQETWSSPGSPHPWCRGAASERGGGLAGLEGLGRWAPYQAPALYTLPNTGHPKGPGQELHCSGHLWFP